jgi:hypothetical protein
MNGILGTSKETYTKEDYTMKAATIRTSRRPVSRPYPNAADRRYFLQRLLDGVLTLATVVGGLTALIFLIFL